MIRLPSFQPQNRDPMQFSRTDQLRIGGSDASPACGARVYGSGRDPREVIVGHALDDRVRRIELFDVGPPRFTIDEQPPSRLLRVAGFSYSNVSDVFASEDGLR